MPRQIESCHPYLKENFWKENQFWKKDTYSKEAQRKISSALLASY